MTEEREIRPGWLPPRAPGARRPPYFRSTGAGEPAPGPPHGAAHPPVREPAPTRPASPPGGDWAPPRPPVASPPAWRPQPSSPAPGPRGGEPARRPTFVSSQAEGPASPLAVASIVLAAISVLLLVLSLGVGYLLCGALSLVALALGLRARARLRGGAPGRRTQVKVAIVFAGIGLTLAAVAAVVWLILQSSGFSPGELQDWLQRELERRNEGRGRPDGGDDVIEAHVRALAAALLR